VIIVPERFVFVSTPRTGSRSISEMLLAHGWNQTKGHHTEPEIVLEEKGDLPVYSVFRNPRDIIVSWYCRLKFAAKPSLAEFCRGVENAWMNPMHRYMEISDKSFNFDDGIENIMTAMGVEPVAGVPHIGGDKRRPIEWTHEAEVNARRTFKRDFDYYEKMTNSVLS
jgi:hypothetical protein